MTSVTQLPESQSSWLTMRDHGIAASLSDLLAHDDRTAHLDLGVDVKGGVAHVNGEVGSGEEREMVRGLVRQQGGLYGAWDLLRLPGQNLNLLDIGCGGKKQYASAIGVDQFAGPGVDVVADLERGLPFDDDMFDHVFAVHVLEHVRDLLTLMADLHRVLRPSGVLHALTPDWRHVNSVADPTHCRLMDVQTFKYFCLPRPGVVLWRPLMVTASEDTVHADLQPMKGGAAPSMDDLARWFD